MKATDDLELRSDDLGPRLAAWMASTAPTQAPLGLVAGAIGRAGTVRQRPAFLMRLGVRQPTLALPDLSRRAQLVLLAGLLLVGIGAASAVGARLLNQQAHIAGLSNSLIVLMPDGNNSGEIRVVRPDGEVVGVAKGNTNGCGRHVLVADGQRVAFAFQGPPVTIAPLDGSDRVIVHEGWAGWSFSPDRTRLAYLDGAAGSLNLTIQSLIDGTTTVVARDLHDASLSLLGWSVDDMLAIGFISNTESRIDLISADGTNRRPLVRQPMSGRTIPSRMVSWSPDGTRLAYAGGELDPGDTWVIDIATGRSTLVATADGRPVNAWTNFANGLYFAWSPDGRMVTYRTNGEYGDGEYALLDLATGESRPVPDAPGVPFWSPDGSRLAFLGHRDPVRLTTFQADMSGRVDQLVEVEAQAIAWSPDSSQIAVLAGRAIDLLDPNGIVPPTRISNEIPYGSYCLTWSEFDTP
jgi:Tol biopolymer transport system component